MKKTKLLLMSAFAALALSACGGSKPGSGGLKPSGDGELPSGGSEIDVQDPEQLESLADSFDNILKNVRETKGVSYTGIQGTIKGEVKNSSVGVSGINFALMDESGQAGTKQTLPYNLNASVKKLGGQLDLTVAKVGKEKEGFYDAAVQAKVTGVTIDASVTGKVPNLYDLIVNKNMAALLDAKDLDVNLNLKDIAANFYLGNGDEYGKMLYADLSGKSIKNALNTLSPIVTNVYNIFLPEDQQMAFDLNALVDAFLPTRKLMFQIPADLSLPADGNYLSPLGMIPFSTTGEQIVSYLAMPKAMGLDVLTVETYKNGSIGAKVEIGKEHLVTLVNTVLPNFIPTMQDDDVKPIIDSILNAISEFSLKASVIVDKNGLVTGVGESLDVKGSYTLKDYFVEMDNFRALLGGTIALELHESLSVSAAYGKYSVKLPTDTDNYQLIDFGGHNEPKPGPSESWEPMPEPSESWEPSEPWNPSEEDISLTPDEIQEVIENLPQHNYDVAIATGQSNFAEGGELKDFYNEYYYINGSWDIHTGDSEAVMGINEQLMGTFLDSFMNDGGAAQGYELSVFEIEDGYGATVTGKAMGMYDASILIYWNEYGLPTSLQYAISGMNLTIFETVTYR